MNSFSLYVMHHFRIGIIIANLSDLNKIIVILEKSKAPFIKSIIFVFVCSRANQFKIHELVGFRNLVLLP